MKTPIPTPVATASASACQTSPSVREASSSVRQASVSACQASACADEASAFVCRSYGKSELAALYLPNILPASANKAFNEWIEAFPGLSRELAANGLTLHSKRYTPAQVRIITGALGEP